MATHASAEKAARQALVHQARNRQVLSNYRSAIKAFRAAIAAKYDSKAVAAKTVEPLLNKVQAVLMKAASKNVIKTRTASRKVSRLSRAMHRVLA